MANFAQFSPKTPFFGKKSEKNGKKKVKNCKKLLDGMGKVCKLTSLEKCPKKHHIVCGQN